MWTAQLRFMVTVSCNLHLLNKDTSHQEKKKVNCSFSELKLLVASDRNTYQTGVRRKRERENIKRNLLTII